MSTQAKEFLPSDKFIDLDTLRQIYPSNSEKWEKIKGKVTQWMKDFKRSFDTVDYRNNIMYTALGEAYFYLNDTSNAISLLHKGISINSIVRPSNLKNNLGFHNILRKTPLRKRSSRKSL
jgi:hypothetical protein